MSVHRSPLPTDLAGRVTLITGATGALGATLVPLFLQHGASVIATGRRRDALDALAASVSDRGPQFKTEPCDLLDGAQVAALVDRVVDEWGRIDVVVHAAGGYSGGRSVAHVSEAEWHEQLSVNLTSAFLVCRAVLPVMERLGHGRIVTISSRAALQVGKNVAPYTVAKAGLIALTQAIAEEQRGRDITANVVLPGVIDTSANRAAMPAAHHDRWVTPAAIGQVVLFLSSDAAWTTTGACIPVYGAS